MRPTQSISRLILAGIIFVAIALAGTVLSPLSVSAEGNQDPPVESPTFDSIPGGSPAGDSDADFAGDDSVTNTSSVVEDLLYGASTLLALM
ncbi:MAG: hypothetical protein GY867_12510 [bacterium]|nr:hypothetical protein [bacterium]